MSEQESNTQRALPLFIIKPGTMSKRDIARAEKRCQIVIIESTEPDGCRLMDPPIAANVPEQARAALRLFRRVMASQSAPTTTFYGENLIRWFVDALMNPEPQPVQKVTKK